MIKRLLYLFFIVTPFFLQAQTEDEKAIAEVVNRLFKGMELGDSAMVHSTFHTKVTMATSLRNKNNEPVLRQEDSIQGFLEAVGKPHKEKHIEEIWNLNIRIDGDLAHAWCDYAFYLDNTFLHCGVDSFHFTRTKDGWKIFQLADTRRKNDCNVPQEIQDKHK